MFKSTIDPEIGKISSKMQEMDVDEDVYDYLPSVVKRNMVYHDRIYTNAKCYSDFVVTGGQNPVLYDIKGKQILSSFHLNTVFKGTNSLRFL